MSKKAWFFILSLYLLFGINAHAVAVTPSEHVKETLETILVVLRSADISVEAKKSEIRGIVADKFDFRAMSQRTLATNWKKATDSEKDRFVKLYSRLLQDTYLVMVEEYTNERIEYIAEKIRKKKYAQIDTKIVTATVEIPVNYKTRFKDGEWKIYDVVIEGISLISNYRTSYQQIAKKEGVSGLIARMEEKLSCAAC